MSSTCGDPGLVEQPARVRRDRLEVAPLRLGVDRAERERRLARPGDAGEDDQRVARDVDVDVPQVVLPRAAHADERVRSRVSFRDRGPASSRHRPLEVCVMRIHYPRGRAGQPDTTWWSGGGGRGLQATRGVRRRRLGRDSSTILPTSPIMVEQPTPDRLFCRSRMIFSVGRRMGVHPIRHDLDQMTPVAESGADGDGWSPRRGGRPNVGGPGGPGDRPLSVGGRATTVRWWELFGRGARGI